MFKKLCILFCFSQAIVLGVFGVGVGEYYVIEKEKNLCGSFEKGTFENPNWLPTGWEAVFLNDEVHTSFLSNISCEQGNIGVCCKELGYRYAGVPIGIEFVSDERAGAEFLAAKGFINMRSFNPSYYKLEDRVTRKEFMKVIMKISGITLNNSCRTIFADVIDDWGCKYIETALDNDYIVGNQGFRPDEPITRSEALKLIFKAKDISKKYDTNSWQEDYISSAYYLGFIDEKFSDYNMSATRGWIFSVAAKTFSEFSN